MNEVVAAGSCCECGSCVLVCPHNVIEYVEGKPKQTAKADASFDHCGISSGIGCDVCAQVCPRLSPREFELHPVAVSGKRSPAVFDGGFGPYRDIFAARAVDPRILEVCQDGGVVTAMLVYGLAQGIFDSAVVSAADPARPCSPKPSYATSEEEAIAAAGSWYTYCPNDLALAEAVDKGAEKVAFVGVPCQVTPLVKAQRFDASLLEGGRKKPKHLERQNRSLKEPTACVALRIGLLCSEVFDFDGLMKGKIGRELGIPLHELRKFNVKGEILVYHGEGELTRIPLKEAQEHARPECIHCGDFSAELADVSCGGVGASDWTITIARTERGKTLLDEMKGRGLLDTRPIEEFENSMKVLLRLARRQHQRVPAAPGGVAVCPPYLAPLGRQGQR